jgi:uncharacterized protein involved in exopolysaccharide biosynthesis
MGILKATLLIATVIILTVSANAQSAPEMLPSGSVKATAAYAEIIFKRTALEADLQALLLDYKEEFPRVKSLRREISVLDDSIEMLMKLPPAANEKLTAALGKLIVRRAELETEFSEVASRFGEDHPDVRRAAKRIEIFDRSIRELLGQ